MMAVVNIGAILEYGKGGSMVRRFGGLATKEGGPNATGTLQAQRRRPLNLLSFDFDAQSGPPSVSLGFDAIGISSSPRLHHDFIITQIYILLRRLNIPSAFTPIRTCWTPKIHPHFCVRRPFAP
jgi:hypothetical protein